MEKKLFFYISNSFQMSHQCFNKRYHNFFIFILCFLSLFTTYHSQPLIKSKVSSVENSAEIEFTWESVNNNDLNPKIIFWNTETFPTSENHTLENSWRYLNEESRYRTSYASSDGKITLTAPSKNGLYSIYYCAENFDGFYCTFQRQIAVISCLNKLDTTSSNVKHVIIFISENHSFDSIYGNYCQAETFSNPTCNYGPLCCEKIPSELNGIKPKELSDIQNSRFDPCHSKACEESEINGGKMDKYIINGVGSNPNNFAAAIDDEFSAKLYFQWARENAISDSFFQSSAGASSQNDMYFAGGKFFFLDNTYAPQNKKIPGAQCRDNFISYTDPTIADLLNTCKVSWTFYGQGLKEKMTSKNCDDMWFDGTDNPFAYFPSLTDSATGQENFRDFRDLLEDIKIGKLPSISYVKALEIYTGHPGNSGGFINEQRLSEIVINKIKESDIYRNNTLVILVPDESGGFYDHIPTPPTSKIDGQIYGPRTQFIIVGDIAKKNYVSHVTIEPASIIRFLQWNWIGEEGQLYTRDRIVNNIGDMLDERKAGVKVPSVNYDGHFTETHIKKSLKFLEEGNN
jgi:phospholipase C